MRSYFLWQLRNKKWIKCKNDIKASASECCFEDYELSSLICVPEYDMSILSKIFGSRAKRIVEEILSKTGVADRIYDMEKPQIYRILLCLPECDKTCTKGGKIYSQLIKQLDDIDRFVTYSKEYRDFIDNGKVLCKHNGIKEYLPIKQVHYSNNKIFSNQILKEINMLCIGMRNGEQKVKKMFGVSALKSISLELTKVVTHPTNLSFQELYRQFLPYVYAYRLIKVKNHQSDRGKLKNTKVILCSDIEIKFEFEGAVHTSTINDYEIAYLTNAKTAYIKIPNRVTDLELLKSGKIEFSEAVSEVISIILDYENEREFFRNLFSQPKSTWDYIMVNDCGDNDLLYLKQAMEEFKLQFDYKPDFWIALAECLGIYYKDDTDAEATVMRLADMSECTIDFAKINSYKSMEAIVNLFLRLNIDVDVFNARAFNEIRLEEYWKAQFIKLKENLKDRYYGYCYDRGIRGEISVAEFMKYVNEYSFCEPAIINSVKINLQSIFEECFGISTDKLLNIIAPEKRVIDIMDGNLDLESAARLLGREGEIIQSPESQHGTNMENATSVAPLLDSSVVVSDIVSLPIEKAEFEPQKHFERKHRSGCRAVEVEKKKLQNGFICEKAVYEKLKEKYKVKWVSGYSVEAGNPDGSDDFGYDMEYCDENGNVVYVEVKSSSGDKIEFTMMQNEIDFGRCHKKAYKVIIFVKSGENPLCLMDIGYIFDLDEGEELFDNKKFAIKAKEYIVSAKVIQREKLD